MSANSLVSCSVAASAYSGATQLASSAYAPSIWSGMSEREETAARWPNNGIGMAIVRQSTHSNRFLTGCYSDTALGPFRGSP